MYHVCTSTAGIGVSEKVPSIRVYSIPSPRSKDPGSEGYAADGDGIRVRHASTQNARVCSFIRFCRILERRLPGFCLFLSKITFDANIISFPNVLEPVCLSSCLSLDDDDFRHIIRTSQCILGLLTVCLSSHESCHQRLSMNASIIISLKAHI